MDNRTREHIDELAFRMAYLVAGCIRKTLTQEEHGELDRWIEASDENMKFFEDLTDPRHLQANLAWMDKVNAERSLRELKDTVSSGAKSRFLALTVSIAAGVALVIGFFFLTNSPAGNERPAPVALPSSPTLPPAKKGITLAIGGSLPIDLSSAALGKVAAGIYKTGDGVLEYRSELSPAVPARHLLSTAAGSQCQVTLADGTRIWLNAGSQLTYPGSFTRIQRQVELNGEAYFEVAKDTRRPFLVRFGNGNSIKVPGTRFNVKWYDDDTSHDVSLLEGKIELDRHGENLPLLPGERMTLTGTHMIKSTGPDAEEIIGWKDGFFTFHNADVNSIMREVERWYDLKVIFKYKTKELFNASILRSEPLNKLLHILELTGKIHFKLENKTIYVLP